MKKTRYLILMLIYLLASFCSAYSQEKRAEIEWFSDAKLGLFIHWGLYSQAAGEWKGKPTKGGEHFMLYERIPIKEYELIANDFNPVGFDAAQWVKTAKDAGMKYVIITAKHHDGFAMYDSQSSDYTIIKRTAFKRDPIKELADVCKKEGLRFGFYYSLGRDWHDPDVPTNWPQKAGRSNTWDYPDEDAKNLPAYIECKVKPQLRELLTNYGTIAMVWFDTPELVTKQQSTEIRELILSLQPDCLINSRIGNGLGDYSIIEQTLMAEIKRTPWEACLTMGRNWSYNKFDTLYKSPEATIRNFVDIVSKGGNLLLNVGPTGEGIFPPRSTETFNGLHDWLKVNGEAIYGTRPWKVYGENLIEGTTEDASQLSFHDAEFDGTPKVNVPDLRFTSKGNVVYVFARSIIDNKFVINSISKEDKINKITLLGSKKNVKWKYFESGLQIDMPLLDTNQIPVYVLKVELK
ncbi:alpha-L-fucosidase [Dysgonomonas alginatilytica]|nr:alpha-L-fucosidase [Dysgonomonas alginatilytica]